MLDQLLAECTTLVSVFHALLVAHATEANTLNNDPDTLVVEVGPRRNRQFTLTLAASGV